MRAAIVALGLLLGATREASAQNASPPAEAQGAPSASGSEFRLGTAVYSGGSSSRAVGSGTYFVTDLGANLRLTPSLHLDLAWALAYARVGYQTGIDSSGYPTFSHDTRFGVGNIFAGVRWHAEGGGALLWFGAGITLPVSALADRGALQLYGAAAMNGLWDSWLYTGHTLSLVARGGYRYRTERFEIDTEAALGILAAIDSERDDTDVVLQFGVTPTLRLGTVSAIGVRLREVFIPTGSGDASQLSATPFARAGFGASWLEARLLMNLDQPLGFAFDRYRVWSLGLTFGTTF